MDSTRSSSSPDADRPSTRGALRLAPAPHGVAKPGRPIEDDAPALEYVSGASPVRAAPPGADGPVPTSEPTSRRTRSRERPRPRARVNTVSLAIGIGIGLMLAAATSSAHHEIARVWSSVPAFSPAAGAGRLGALGPAAPH